MTAAAGIRRAFRHKVERSLINHLSRKPAFRLARQGQIKASARQILQRHTSLLRRDGVIAAV